ncbi:MAG: hypothetical protein HY820_35470 [Acidobacteria bacterium]|nr:hypothetical protein [Acidobacteriota bacterium]
MGGLLAVTRKNFGRSLTTGLAILIALEMAAANLFGADWPSPNGATTKNILTNQGVVALARAGYSEGFIIDIIYQKQTQFDVSVDGLAWLAKQGLSERVIRTMVTNERKEEQTAIVPATVQIVTQEQAPVQPARLRRGNYVEQTVAPPVTRRTEVQVPLPVIFPAPGPTSGPSQSSWYVKGYDRDKWYIVPNVPVLPASTR